MAPIYTIYVDHREKKPLPFPAHISFLSNPMCPTHSRSQVASIRTVNKRLPAADYILGDEAGVFYTGPGGCILERKLSIDELQTNLFDLDRRASFIRALTAMQAYRFPVLFLEASPARFFKAGPRVPNPGHVHDALIALLLDMRIHLHYLPMSATSRAELGEWAARTLIVGDRCGAKQTVDPVPGQA